MLGIMQGWYRADAITGLADGAAVASWPDSTANARTLSQATADYRPLYKVSIQNGRPAVRFDGSNDLLTGTFAGSLQFTVFSVQRPDGSLANLPYIYLVPGNGKNLWGGYLSSSQLYFGFFSGGGWRTYTPVHTSSVSLPEVWVLSYDQAWFRSWVNRSALSSLADVNTPTLGNELRIGRYGEELQTFDGDIFELAFFNVALTDRDRQRVERYLMRKWGL
jgi:hypothetical protein